MKDVKKYLSEQLMRIGEIKYGIDEDWFPEERMFNIYQKCRGAHELAGVRYMRMLDGDEWLDYSEILDTVYDEILE